jgi:hypothetical protein
MTEPVTIDLKNATIYIVDGTGTPNELEIKLDEGNLTYTERRNVEYKKNRGILDHVRLGDQEPMDLSLEARFSKLVSHSSENASIREALTQTGQASSWVSTGGDCEPYAVDIVVKLDRTCTTLSDPDEIMTFSEFRYEEMGGDFSAGQLSISGKCNATGPSSVRTTIT